MKQKILIMFLLIVTLLCGCKRAAKGNRISLESMSFTADITYYNEDYSADCVVDRNGNLTAVFSQPKSLAGLKFEFSPDKNTVTFNGIKIENSDKYLPQNSVVSVIDEVFKLCNNADAKESKHNFVVKGTVGKNEYVFTAAPSGLPISLEVPDLALKVDFNNIKLANANAEGN